jgi:hypothetical protein
VGLAASADQADSMRRELIQPADLGVHCRLGADPVVVDSAAVAVDSAAAAAVVVAAAVLAEAGEDAEVRLATATAMPRLSVIADPTTTGLQVLSSIELEIRSLMLGPSQ